MKLSAALSLAMGAASPALAWPNIFKRDVNPGIPQGQPISSDGSKGAPLLGMPL
jgi:hypothetical protein